MSTATLPTPLPQAHGTDPIGYGGDDSLYEIVNGVCVELPSKGIRAVWLNSRLFKSLAIHVDDHQLGTAVSEALFILDEAKDLRRRPDVAFVSKETWPLDKVIPYEGDWAVVPDLAVEVISPHDLFDNVLAKVGEYFAHAVQQVWVIAPQAEEIYVYEGPQRVRILGGQDQLDGGDLLPGFRLNSAELFRRTI